MKAFDRTKVKYTHKVSFSLTWKPGERPSTAGKATSFQEVIKEPGSFYFVFIASRVWCSAVWSKRIQITTTCLHRAEAARKIKCS